MWRLDDPQGSESHKVRHKIVPFTRGRGLDLGCGPWKAWPHFTGVDNFDEWNDGTWAPDVRSDVGDLSQFADRSLDFIFSSHLLEHLDDTQAYLTEWWRLIKPGGHLVLYLPHKDFYPNIGEEGGNPDHKHDFEPDDIIEIMTRVGKAWNLVVNQDRNERNEYSFLQVYRKEKGTGHKFTRTIIEPGKSLALIRYGAFGDHLQASTVLPKLAAQGWHITYVTTPYGEDVLKHDPNIDAFWVQDTDQVPNTLLEEYWKGLGYEFDKVINLSESIEGSLLTIPGRRVHSLSKEARHMLCDVNYFDFINAIADVEGPPEVKFFPTDQEIAKVKKYRERFEGPVITWALAGSSVHKVWPWTQEVVAWLLENTDASVVFTGSKPEQELEFAIYQGLLKYFFDISHEDSNEMKLSGCIKKLNEKYPGRVQCTSGHWSIRESLTFAQFSDVVMGPETGMLNAVANEPQVAKVVMLSHSTNENLTRDWVNTTVIAPIGVECYPCHRMHYTRDFCPQHEETGASVCAASITPQRIYKAITGYLSERKAA